MSKRKTISFGASDAVRFFDFLREIRRTEARETARMLRDCNIEAGRMNGIPFMGGEDIGIPLPPRK